MTSATSSGRTQCTRENTSGEPKRVDLGGGTSTVILSEGERLQLVPQPFSSAVIARADAAGIDQPSAVIVVAEQQGAERRAPAFRIGPADDDELLAVEKLDLDPDPAIAGK